MSGDIVRKMITSSKALKLHGKVIYTNTIGEHSIRADGAMALKIMGYKDSTISKFGRWTSDTWKMYIHRKISKLLEGLAQEISTPISYHNIYFIGPPQR